MINSIPNYKDNTYYNTQYILQKWGVADYTQKKALTKCPNEGYDTTAARMPQMKKTVHMDDQAEWLYFYVKESNEGNDNTDYYNVYEVIGKTYNTAGVLQDTFVLGSTWPYPIANNYANMGTRIMSDLSHGFTYHTGTDTQFAHNQSQIAVQNVSPGYINECPASTFIANSVLSSSLNVKTI